MKAYRLPRHPEAFTLSPSKTKRPRQTDDGHLKWIRTLPCLICGKRGVHAAHIRMAALRYGKRETGKSEKPSDKWTLPLCAEHHTDGPEAQHRGSEAAFWQRYGIDPFIVAMALYQCSGDDEAGETIVQEHRPTSGPDRDQMEVEG